jgi:hypothetical protein
MTSDAERFGYLIGLLFGAAMLFAFLTFAIVAIVKAITRRTRTWIIAGTISALFLALPALLIFGGAISGFLGAIRQQSAATSYARINKELIGEWKGADNVQQTGYMILNSDRTARLIIANQVLDGPSLGGRFEWRVDTTHEPMWLDFVGTRSDGTAAALPMIVRFVGDRKIQVRWNSDFTSRPMNFADPDVTTQLVLSKQ